MWKYVDTAMHRRHLAVIWKEGGKHKYVIRIIIGTKPQTEYLDQQQGLASK